MSDEPNPLQDTVTRQAVEITRMRDILADVANQYAGKVVTPDGVALCHDFLSSMEAVFAEAAQSGVALEISAHPERLDLNDIHARQAIEMGIPLSINTDAHSPEELDLMHFGIATARRGWVQARHVINTWQPERLLTWLRNRG